MGFFRQLLSQGNSRAPARHRRQGMTRLVPRPVTTRRCGFPFEPDFGPPERVVYLARDIAPALGRISALRAQGIEVYLGLYMGIPDDAEVVVDAGCQETAPPFRHWAEMLEHHGFSRQILYLHDDACVIAPAGPVPAALPQEASDRSRQLLWLQSALRPPPGAHSATSPGARAGG